VPRDPPPARTGQSDLSESGKAKSPALHHDFHGMEGRPEKVPHPLSTEEIRRWLLRFRYDPEFRCQRRVPLKPLAEFVGLHRDSLYEVMLRRRASLLVRAKISPAIRAIDDGRLRFRRRGQTWEIEGGVFS
jgi:hypothetical protein